MNKVLLHFIKKPLFRSKIHGPLRYDVLVVPLAGRLTEHKGSMPQCLGRLG